MLSTHHHSPPPTHPPSHQQVPKRRGQDPTADVREKALQRLATKGVVRLFNAIAKAQKQLREAEEASGSRAKAVKLGKASFLAQLKGSSAAAAGSAADQPLVPSAPRQAIPGVAAAAAVPAAGASGSKKQQQRRGAAADSSSEDEEDAAGWDVLKQGFVGLQGGWHVLPMIFVLAIWRLRRRFVGLHRAVCCGLCTACVVAVAASMKDWGTERSKPCCSIPWLSCAACCRWRQDEGLGQGGQR